MEYVILDLEWNTAYAKKVKHFMSEIIEFGAVKFDENFNIIDTFSMLVTPQVSKRLTGKVKELTNISKEELDNGGCTYTHVLSKFKKFLKDALLMTWGTGDILALMENSEYYEKNNKIDYVSSYCNIQRYCAAMLNAYDAGKQLGLLNAAQMLELDVTDVVQHRAINDSLLSYQVFKSVYTPETFSQYTISMDELYERLTFKPYYITDLHNDLVEKSYLRDIVCCECGTRFKPRKAWSVKNKAFCCETTCPNCGSMLTARVRYRMTYDGVTVRKRVALYSGEDNAPDKCKTVS